MKTTITSDISKTSARYRAMARLLPAALKKATQDLAQNEALPLFQNTVATWEHDVQFQVVETPRGHTVQTQDQIYAYVDKGTRAHEIAAKRAPLLRFTGPYQPKTKVNVISSFNGGRGTIWTSKLSVHHPGTLARNFSQIILKRIQAKAANRVRKALNEAAAGAGFGL